MGKEDEAKLQADTEGVVVQQLPKDVAAKVDTRLAAAVKAVSPAPKEAPQSHTPSKPPNSTIDVMAKLHEEAKHKLQKGKKQHETKKAKQNKTSSNIDHHAKK